MQICLATRRAREDLPPNTTRFAGLEIGKTKLAAFATKAQIKSNGMARVRALRAAASTAGVKTTAVASLERKIVMTVPAAKINAKRRRAEPRATLTA